jgi:hypothetical protein
MSIENETAIIPSAMKPKIMKFISVAIEILRKELPQQYLLFDENCHHQKSDCPSDNLPIGQVGTKSITLNN